MAQEDGGKLRLSILTPEGSAGECTCDSVILNLADDSSGHGGGGFGIHRGHVKTHAALAPGKVKALKDGKEILSIRISSGFAVVDSDRVTVLAEAVEK